jgi:hypothetical protein
MLKDGDAFINVPVPEDNERQRLPQPVVLTRPAKAVSAVGIILTISTWLSRVPVF